MQAELRRSGYEDMIAAGIVLTGGTSKMEGVVELAEEIFHMPVRLGVPTQEKGLSDIVKNPIYATSVGLLHYGLRQQMDDQFESAKRNSEGIISRIKNWFRSNF